MTHIENAYRIICAMTVRGDNQDLAVAAKNELRAAMEEARKEAENGGQANQRLDGGKPDQQS